MADLKELLKTPNFVLKLIEFILGIIDFAAVMELTSTYNLPSVDKNLPGLSVYLLTFIIIIFVLIIGYLLFESTPLTEFGLLMICVIMMMSTITTYQGTYGILNYGAFGSFGKIQTRYIVFMVLSVATTIIVIVDAIMVLQKE